MTILLTEEASMVETVRALVARHDPNLREGLDWFIFSFNGKSDLENNITKRMRDWDYGTPRFLILRDADGGDCRAVKAALAKLADAGGKPYKIRIICQVLEGWFIGDSEAVRAAYPRCSFSNAKAAYRDPDRITNASEELARLTGDRTKVNRAKSIAPHLVPERNCSHSFKLFFQTLTGAFPAPDADA